MTDWKREDEERLSNLRYFNVFITNKEMKRLISNFRPEVIVAAPFALLAGVVVVLIFL